MTEKQSGKRRKILRVLIGILLVMIIVILIVVICCLHFGEMQIQPVMQKIVSVKVIKHKEELSEIAKNLNEHEMLSSSENDENDYYTLTEIYYKDLEDENINKMFETFNLMTVSKISGDGSVEFSISPVSNFSFLWSDYDYGFYYTENDEPVNTVWTNEIEETEFEYTIEDFGRYYYRTEKITDNWWYYETKWLWFYP